MPTDQTKRNNNIVVMNINRIVCGVSIQTISLPPALHNMTCYNSGNAVKPQIKDGSRHNYYFDSWPPFLFTCNDYARRNIDIGFVHFSRIAVTDDGGNTKHSYPQYSHVIIFDRSLTRQIEILCNRASRYKIYAYTNADRTCDFRNLFYQLK